MYQIDKSCEFTEDELKTVQTCENDEKFIYLSGKRIGRVLPAEAAYCKKVTGVEYNQLLRKVLAELDPDPWKAIHKLFDQYGNEYEEENIPNVTAFTMQEYIFKIAKEQQS
jgi:hypothetical protein